MSEITIRLDRKEAKALFGALGKGEYKKLTKLQSDAIEDFYLTLGLEIQTPDPLE